MCTEHTCWDAYRMGREQSMRRGAMAGVYCAAGCMMAIVGCSDAQLADGADGLQDNNSAIIGGTVATASDDVSASTVAVVYNEEYVKQRKATCSGTLIGKRAVLTADHCFDHGTDCRVLFALDVEDPNAVSIPCSAKRGADGDIAVVVLERDAPAGYVPVRYLTLNHSLQVQDPIIFAGYGVTDSRVDSTRGKLRFGSQVVSSVDEPRKGFRYTSFSGGAGQCSGDSGGPTYVRNENGSLSVIGVIVSGSLNCREGFQTDVRHYTDWIQKTLADAGAEDANSGASPTQPDHPTCKDGSSDPDGDGWGWEDGRSCVVVK